MDRPNTVLRTVIKKFPEHTQTIIRLFVESENFQEICEDYVICLNATRKRGKSQKGRKQILEEYQDALRELEKELLANVQTTKRSD